MIYTQFENFLLERMRKLNPDKEVEMQNVKKNNGVELRGLCVRKKGEYISPTIYVQNLFSEVTNIEDIDEVAERIQNVIERSRIEKQQFEGIDELLDFDKVAERIFFTVVNKDKNMEQLRDMPYRDLLDLAVIYRIHVNRIDGSLCSIQIKNEFMKKWSVQEETLYNLATRNTERLFGTSLRSMNEVLIEISKGKATDLLLHKLEEENRMYVSTNDEECYGAEAIFLNEKYRREVHNKIGDFIIIPSSVHETILLPYEKSMNAGELRKIICQVNSEQLDPIEVLSDNVYLFKDNEIQIMY